MPLRPVTDRLLIKADPVPLCIGRIILPSGARSKPQSGVVVAAGPGRWGKDGKFVHVYSRPGERVFWNEFDGCLIDDPESGAKLTVLCDERVLAREACGDA